MFEAAQWSLVEWWSCGYKGRGFDSSTNNLLLNFPKPKPYHTFSFRSVLDSEGDNTTDKEKCSPESHQIDKSRKLMMELDHGDYFVPDSIENEERSNEDGIDEQTVNSNKELEGLASNENNRKSLSAVKMLLYAETPSTTDDDAGSSDIQNKVPPKQSEPSIRKKLIFTKPSIPELGGPYSHSEVLPKKTKGEGLVKKYVEWTKNDEIFILKELINHKAETKTKSIKNYGEVYDYVKPFLCHRGLLFTVTDLKNKVRCLREKYMRSVKKKKTLSSPDEIELFNLSDKLWGCVNKDHETNEQLARQSTSSLRHYESLDPQGADKILVGELGMAFKAMINSRYNDKQVVQEQVKSLLGSVDTRKHYARQLLEVLKSSEKADLSEEEEQKIARSNSDLKMQHARLVSDAYNALL